MDTETLKKKLQKQNPLMMSPMAFALAACGGGGTSEDVENDNTQVITSFSLSDIRNIPLTGDNLIDVNTSGSAYVSNKDNPIYYGVSGGHYGETWNDISAVSQRLQSVMEQFSTSSGIKLENAGTYESPNAAAAAGVSVVFSYDNFVSLANPEDTSVWYAYYPHADQNNYGVDHVGGNLFVSMNAEVWGNVDQRTFENLLLETDVGYAQILDGMRLTLGLKNPDVVSNGRPQIEDTNLANFDDNVNYSIAFIDPSNADDEVHTSLGIMDVLTLNYLYGKNTSINSGDTVHELSSESASTIVYDASGIDTVSFELATTDVNVALPELVYTESLTSLVDLQLGYTTRRIDENEKIDISLFGEIENVTTGSGNDLIIGNDQNNLIIAGAGDDVIYLSEGEDVVYGGEGHDTFWVFQNFLNNDLIGNNTVIKDFEIGIDKLEYGVSDDGAGALVYSRNSNGDATYTNDLGAYVVLEGIEPNILMIA